MKGSKQEKINIHNAKLTFWVAAWLFLCSFIFAGIRERMSLITFFFMFLAILTGTVIICLDKSQRGMKYIPQILIVIGVLAFMWDLAFCNTSNENKNMFIAIVGLAVLNFAFMCLIWKYRKRILQYNLKIMVGKIFNNLGLFLGLYFLIVIFAILNIPNFGAWFMGDEYAYYSSIMLKRGTWDFTLNTIDAFAIGGHTSYAYSVLLYIGEYLWPENGNGIRLINLIMSIVTILCFYQITDRLFIHSSKLVKWFLTAMFTFSPLFLGISYSVNTDFPMLCFFVLFVWSVLYQKKILQWLSALSVCFSKEIGIIVIFGYYVRESIVLCLNSKKKIYSFFKEFFRIDRILVYSSAFFYIAHVFLSNAGWMINLRTSLQKNDSVSLPNILSFRKYILYKFEEIFMMNYSWVILALVFGVVFLLVYTQIKERRCMLKEWILSNRYIIPLSTAFVGFFFISIKYITYLHFRYVQLSLFFYVLLFGALTICLFRKKILQNIFLGTMVVLFFTSSYILTDPVTFALFPNINTGNGREVSTRRYFYGGESYGYAYIEEDERFMSDHLLSEGIMYNRQKLYLQPLLEDALTRINYDSNTLIVLDNFGGWLENTCRPLFGQSQKDEWYWNIDNKTVTNNNNDVKMNLSIAEAKPDLGNYSKVYYFDFPFNEYRKDDFLDQYDVIDSFYEKKGIWKFKVYCVK